MDRMDGMRIAIYLQWLTAARIRDNRHTIQQVTPWYALIPFHDNLSDT